MGSKRPLAVLLVALLTGTSLQAGPGQEPASLLLFPFFDSRAGAVTVVTVTNTHDDMTPDSRTGLMRGTVDVEFVYIDAATCKEFNRVERLTPDDTFTAMVSAHHAAAVLGFFWIVARDPTTGRAIDHDYLVGQAVCLDAVHALEVGYNPIDSRALTGAGNPTDLDADDRLDLNGLEYEGLGDLAYVPRFYGQFGPAGIASELILLNLSGGASFEASVDFDIFNDNESEFSAEHTFKCWELLPLAAISGAFDNGFLAATGDDPDELLGFSSIETGWFIVNGGEANSTMKNIHDPAIVVMLIDRVGPYGATDLPFESEQKQFNATLYPRGVDGDNED
ncbi:MAG: hypothetical protein AB1486_09190 [Planctomycetota bacterium]